MPTFRATVIDGLAELGVLGMTAPTEFGGRGFSQLGYTRIMEVIGGHCASTAVFVNAHHSHRHSRLAAVRHPRAETAAGCPTWSGQELAAFALTEPEAGSDAANVQTTATPSADGKTYILNGEKRYITNGAIAQVLTVMARTPVPGSPAKRKVTAFLVTPDMPGFEVVEARMAQVRHPRHRHGPAGVSQHARPGRERARPGRQGPARRPDRARFRPDHLRRQLHRGGQDVPQGGRRPRQKTRAIQADR